MLMKFQLLFETLIDLGLLQCVMYIASFRTQKLMFDILKERTISLNTTKLVWVFMIVFVVMQSHTILRINENFPFSTKFISHTAYFQQFFGFFFLKHSTYHHKFLFQMFLASFLNYHYLKSYPHCNVTLTNIIYFTFIAYQLTHNLFKFSFQFELCLTQINRGNLSAILPATIQNAL
jgi:hypothetical protein